MRRWAPAPALLLWALGSCTAPNPDQVSGSGGGSCVGGRRGCIGARPVECPSGGGSLAVASCPSGATCDHGLCLPPAGAAFCITDGDCDHGRVCTAVVDPQVRGVLSSYCLPPEGVTGGAAPCSDDRECQTNLCVGPTPAARVCLRTCRLDTECPSGSGCRALAATITGVAGTVHGCVPL